MLCSCRPVLWSARLLHSVLTAVADTNYCRWIRTVRRCSIVQATGNETWTSIFAASSDGDRNGFSLPLSRIGDMTDRRNVVSHKCKKLHTQIQSSFSRSVYVLLIYATNCLNLLILVRYRCSREMCMAWIYLAICIYNSIMFCLFCGQLSVHFVPCCPCHQRQYIGLVSVISLSLTLGTNR